MSKRKPDAIEDHQEEEDEKELKTIFVDTSLDTHFILPVSPLLSFSLLKERIVMQHSKCFPDFGEIKIDALKVKREENYYNLPESMLLGKAFHGIEGWFVFADVAGTLFNNRPVKVQSISGQKLQPILINCKHGLNHTMPNNVSVRQENGLNICYHVAMKLQKRVRKKRKCDATAVEALASSSPAENAHKFENNNARETSLLKTEPSLMPCSDGGTIEPKQLVGKKDDLQKNKAAASNVLPSKVVETSTDTETRKKENRYGEYNIAGHVPDASSVSTDAVAQTDIARRFPEILGNMEGNTLNQESGAHNAEYMSGSRVKRTKKTKKGGGDGVEKNLAVTSGKLPNIMKNVVATFDNEKINIVEDATPPELTDGSKLLLSEREAVNLVERTVVNEKDAAPLKLKTTEAVNLVERTAANEEVAPSKPLGLKSTESENSSKRRKTRKPKSSLKGKQDSSNKRENDHLESAETRQKGNSTKEGGTFTEVRGVDYTEAACGSPAKNTTKKDVDGINESHAAQFGPVPDVIQGGVTAMDGENLICERESDDKRTAEEGVMEPRNTTKRKKTHKTKTTVALKQDLSSLRYNNDQEIADSKQKAEEMLQPADISKPEQTKSRPGKRSASKRKTHLQESSGFPSKELLNEKMIEMTAPKTVTDNCLRENEINDPSDQSQKYLDELNDIPAPTVSANVAEETIVDKPKASKQKTKKSKQNERTSQAVTQLMNDNLVTAGTGQIGSELLQPVRSSKPEESIDLSSVKPKKRSKSKRTSPAIDAPEIPVTEQVGKPDGGSSKNSGMGGKSGNEHQKEVGGSELEHLNETSVQKVFAHESDMRDLEKQTAPKSKRKKPNQTLSIDTSSSLMVSKTGYESERIPLLDHQLPSDGHEAEQTNVIGVESVQPPQVDHPEVNAEVLSDKPKSKPQKKHIAIKPQKKVGNSLFTNSSLGNGENEHLNDVSVLKVSAHEANTRNLEKQMNKSNRKKPDQTSSVDASSSLMTSNKGCESGKLPLVAHQLLSDGHEADQTRLLGVEQPLQVLYPEVDAEVLSENPKTKPHKKRSASEMNLPNIPMKQQSAMKAHKTSVEQADDVMPMTNENNAENVENISLYEKCQDGSTEVRKVGYGELEHLNETSVHKGSAPEADIRNLEKQTSKSKQKKLSQPSSVDTSSSFMISKKGYESESIPLVDHQLPSDAHEAEQMRTIGVEYSQSPQINNPEVNGDITSDKPKKRPRKKRPASEKNLSNLPSKQQSTIKTQKTAGDGLLADSSIGDGEHGNLNDMRNLEKQTTSKSKQKKLNQSLSVDTSSSLTISKKGDESEKISLVGHQLQSDVNEAEQIRVIGVGSFQSPQIDNPEVIDDITSGKPKRGPQKKHSASEKNLLNLPMKQQPATKTQVVEQADDENQEKISSHELRHDSSTEVRKLDNQPKSTLKVGKLDLSLSEDTSSNEHNLITSKSKESKRSGQVTSELQNDIQESKHLNRSGAEPLKLQQISQHKEHLDIQSVTVKKVMQKKLTFSANGLSEEEQPDAFLTNGNGNVAKHGKGLSLPEGHYNDPNEILSQDVASAEKMKPEKPPASRQKVKNSDKSTSVDTKSKKENPTVSNKNSGSRNYSLDVSLSKSITARDGGKKPQSSTNNSTMAKKVTGTKLHVVENNPVTKSGVIRSNMNDRNRSSGTPSFISGSSAKRTHLGNTLKEVEKKNNQDHVFKTPSTKNITKPANALPQKKHLPATLGVLFGDLSSDSSDSELERNGSNDGTRTPDDSSSSDYSEGESKGEVVTSQLGSGSEREKTNLKVSGLKGMNLESILRSSSRYKKAKLVASQSQVEDDESEPPEFVPDSQA